MSSYSSFVSRIEVAEDSVDTPKFLGKVSFKDLKLKVIASIIFPSFNLYVVLLSYSFVLLYCY